MPRRRRTRGSSPLRSPSPSAPFSVSSEEAAEALNALIAALYSFRSLETDELIAMALGATPWTQDTLLPIIKEICYLDGILPTPPPPPPVRQFASRGIQTIPPPLPPVRHSVKVQTNTLPKKTAACIQTTPPDVA